MFLVVYLPKPVTPGGCGQTLIDLLKERNSRLMKVFGCLSTFLFFLLVSRARLIGIANNLRPSIQAQEIAYDDEIFRTDLTDQALSRDDDRQMPPPAQKVNLVCPGPVSYASLHEPSPVPAVEENHVIAKPS